MPPNYLVKIQIVSDTDPVRLRHGEMNEKETNYLERLTASDLR
jgi:hypothetical protein